MSQKTSRETSRALFKPRVSGWAGVGLMALLYTILYICNFWVPLNRGSYTNRIWEWSQFALTAAALIILIAKRRAITPGRALLGLALAVPSAASRWFYDLEVLRHLDAMGMRFLLECASVWLCFMAGDALFRDLSATRVAAFQPPLREIGRSVLFGIVMGIPLAIVNNLYFYFNAPSVQFENVFYSAYKALSPGIAEEIVFRFLILAFCLTLLKSSAHLRLATAASVFLAVVPHSLNHLPDLFLENVAMGFFMLIVTSLLFGLPMAWLQLKRNLEAAMAFHGFIDFARFLFGF
ncbi:MAG: hypothetical protein JXA21_19100 [Anaerolineae bacterium]|nr:hypothetical protein [Anaerolineae bacterium]